MLGRVAQIRVRKHHKPYARRSWRRFPGIAVERTNEAIATARQRLHELRIVGLVFKRGAQPFDGGIEAVLEVDERPFRARARWRSSSRVTTSPGRSSIRRGRATPGSSISSASRNRYILPT